MAVLINDELLKSALSSESIQEKNYADVKNLCLDFKKIKKIENLWKFNSLVKLQLQHNKIKVIEGLSHLTQLKWLDLSFNRIEVIQGLENLVSLNELSLYHNFISHLQGLDNLCNLQVLSLGHNKITSYEEIGYLRTIKSLKSLTFEGNPVCSENTRLKVLVRLPNLQILNHKFVDLETVQLARARFRADIASLEEMEREAKINAEKEEATQTEMVLYEDAFIPEWKNGKIVQSILQSDKSYDLANSTSTHAQQYTFAAELQESFAALTMEAISAHEKRHAELLDFKCKVEDITIKTRIKLCQQIQELSTTCEVDKAQRSDLNINIPKKRKEIITTEVRSSETIEDLLEALETQLQKINTDFLKAVSSMFNQLKNKSNNLASKVEDVSETEDPDEHKRLPSLQKSYVKNLDQEELRLQKTSSAWITDTIKELAHAERARHRDNLAFIIQSEHTDEDNYESFQI